MVGLEPLRIDGVALDGSVRVTFTAGPLEPPKEADKWVIDPDTVGARLESDSVTITATIKPEGEILTVKTGSVVSTTDKWPGKVSTQVVADITQRESLYLELSVDETGQTVRSDPDDLSDIKDSVDTPQVQQDDEQPDFTAGQTLNERSTERIQNAAQNSSLPDSVWEQKSGLTPKLQSYEETQTEDGGTQQRIVDEFEPLAVTRLGGTLPWDTDSTQLQCGATITDATDDMNVRLVYHAICTMSQLETLKEMRSRPNNIKLISHAFNGRTTFDELRFDRVVDANGALSASDGKIREPIYKIQLQSKENSN